MAVHTNLIHLIVRGRMNGASIADLEIRQCSVLNILIFKFKI